MLLSVRIRAEKQLGIVLQKASQQFFVRIRLGAKTAGDAADVDANAPARPSALETPEPPAE